MRKLRRKFFKFIALPHSEKCLFVEALYYIYTSKLLLLILPFRLCVKMMACKTCNKKEANPADLNEICKAVIQTNYFAIWKNHCLVQSFAVRRILNKRRIQSVLSIGVAKDEEKELKAHAWIKSGEVELVSRQDDFITIFNVY